MIIDCFTINDELDMLRLRMHELAGVVDAHIAVESFETFTDHRKPAYLSESLIGGWRAGVETPLHVHVVPLSGGSAWEREASQRQALTNILADMELSPDDLILLSDVDEIPRANAVRDVDGIPELRQATAAFDQVVYFYNPTCHNLLPHWYGTRAVRYGRMASPQSYRATEWLRPDDVRIPEAGWHFSYFLDTDGIRRKVASYSHTEVNRPEYMSESNLRAAMCECRSFVPHDGQRFERVVPHDLPAYVMAHPERFGLTTAVPA